MDKYFHTRELDHKTKACVCREISVTTEDKHLKETEGHQVLEQLVCTALVLVVPSNYKCRCVLREYLRDTVTKNLNQPT